MKIKPGLGELLRYLAELVDKGSEETYRNMNIRYRPRFTPVLRAMHEGAVTIQDVTAATRLTQGAVSQSVALMEQEGIVSRQQLSDGRSSALTLTPEGEALTRRLLSHWEAIFGAIATLEQDAGWPVMRSLETLIHCLETRGFQERIALASAAPSVTGEQHAINRE